MSTELNLMTREWLYVFNKARTDIAECYTELGSFNVSHDRSNYLRGKIDGLRAIVEIDPRRAAELTINPFQH